MSLSLILWLALSIPSTLARLHLTLFCYSPCPSPQPLPVCISRYSVASRSPRHLSVCPSLYSLHCLVDLLKICPFAPRVILWFVLLIPSTLALLHLALSLNPLVDSLNTSPFCTSLYSPVRLLYPLNRFSLTHLEDSLNTCLFAPSFYCLLYLPIPSTIARVHLVLFPDSPCRSS